MANIGRGEKRCFVDCARRPAIANERLKRNSAGDIMLQLKSPYRDGTTPIVMSRLDKIAGSDFEQPQVSP